MSPCIMCLTYTACVSLYVTHLHSYMSPCMRPTYTACVSLYLTHLHNPHVSLYVTHLHSLCLPVCDPLTQPTCLPVSGVSLIQPVSPCVWPMIDCSILSIWCGRAACWLGAGCLVFRAVAAHGSHLCECQECIR